MLMTRWILGGAITAVISLGSAPGAAAQSPGGGIVPGRRVRIAVTGAETPWAGVIVRYGGDTLWLARDDAADTSGIASAAVRKIWISQGQRRQVWRGTRKGFLIGAAAGLAYGALGSIVDPEGAEFFGGPLGAMGFFAAFGAVPGTLIGAATGIPRREVWVRIPLR